MPSERERQRSDSVNSPASPRQIMIDPTISVPPMHGRAGSVSVSVTSPNALSPSRAIGPHARHHRDSERRVRDDHQMQQDLEFALSMSRARSGSILPDPSPGLRPSHMHYPTSSPIDETSFPMLSDAEEAEMDRARRSGFRDELGSDDEHPHRNRSHDGYDDGSGEDEHEHEHGHGVGRSMGSSGYDSHHGLLPDDRHGLPRRNSHGPDGAASGSAHGLDSGLGGPNAERRNQLGLPQLTLPRNRYDFGAMENFAAKEREEFGTGESPLGGHRGSEGLRQRVSVPSRPTASEEEVIQPGSYDTALDRTNTVSQYGDDHDNIAFSPKESDAGTVGNGQTGFHRRRQRKLSQSNPLSRRGGKLALFEGFGSQGGGGGTTDTGDMMESPASVSVGIRKAPRPVKNVLPRLPTLADGNNTNGFTAYSDAAPGPGHDRPYRFSFYSNSLPVTIHARTLGELPGEGQTFEDLFKGRASVDDRDLGDVGQDSAATATAQGTDQGSLNSASQRRSGVATPTGDAGPHQSNGKISLLTRAAGGAGKAGGGGGDGAPGSSPEEDPEAGTWWLDVLSPTDEEMRMLSKVFGIHPLTTEDILLEETREKIELFRNYYLVCFRSFDQDPYSQTYLEPLNMYIIVFREGTLSFHFRGTPHPQNVRRRIKQLKDYISVTSDWISYALIDDITDAFGPLIQSIEYEVDSIDELVLILKDAEQSDMLRRIGTCRKKVMGLLRLMGNKADVVKGLAKRCNEQWLVAPKSDIGLYLSDIQDHLITMTQNLNHYEKILSRSHSNYLAQISIEMTDANNQINDVLSKLTALGTVLIPMNLVTGLWGMNVHVPGQDVLEGYQWFGGILGCLCAFAILGAFATYKCFVR